MMQYPGYVGLLLSIGSMECQMSEPIASHFGMRHHWQILRIVSIQIPPASRGLPYPQNDSILAALRRILPVLVVNRIGQIGQLKYQYRLLRGFCGFYGNQRLLERKRLLKKL